VGLVTSYHSKEVLRDEFKPANLEETIRRWLKNFNYSIKELPAGDSYFTLEVSQIPNHPVVISEFKSYGQYLVIQGSIEVSQQHQRIIEKLPPGRIREINHDITIELARVGTEYLQSMPRGIVFQRHVPITNSLTQFVVIEAVQRTAIEENLIIELIRKELGQ